MFGQWGSGWGGASWWSSPHPRQAVKIMKQLAQATKLRLRALGKWNPRRESFEDRKEKIRRQIWDFTPVASSSGAVEIDVNLQMFVLNSKMQPEDLWNAEEFDAERGCWKSQVEWYDHYYGYYGSSGSSKSGKGFKGDKGLGVMQKSAPKKAAPQKSHLDLSEAIRQGKVLIVPKGTSKAVGHRERATKLVAMTAPKPAAAVPKGRRAQSAATVQAASKATSTAKLNVTGGASSSARLVPSVERTRSEVSGHRGHATKLVAKTAPTAKAAVPKGSNSQSTATPQAGSKATSPAKPSVTGGTSSSARQVQSVERSASEAVLQDSPATASGGTKRGEKVEPPTTHVKLDWDLLKHRLAIMKAEVAKEKSRSAASAANQSAPKRVRVPLAPNTKDTFDAKCHAGHSMLFYAADAQGWWCTACATQFERGTAFHGCRICDFDQCSVCVRKAYAQGRRPSPGASAPPAKKAKQPPSASASESSSASSPGASPSSSPSPSPPKKARSSGTKSREPPVTAAASKSKVRKRCPSPVSRTSSPSRSSVTRSSPSRSRHADVKLTPAAVAMRATTASATPPRSQAKSPRPRRMRAGGDLLRQVLRGAAQHNDSQAQASTSRTTAAKAAPPRKAASASSDDLLRRVLRGRARQSSDARGPGR